MTLITFQDGKAVMRDGKVGTEQECCCTPCDASLLDQNAQPDVTVQSTCVCEAGTHDGNYPFETSNGGTVWAWSGTTTCDYIEGDAEVYANIIITVECDATTGDWIVSVGTYQVDARFMSGIISTKALSVVNGVLTGTVVVPLLGPGDDCQVTLTFG